MFEAIKDRIETLNAALAERGFEERIELLPDVTKEAIAACEKRIGFALPPSYGAFVTTLGRLRVSGVLTGNGWGNDTEVLGPEKMADDTARCRDEAKEMGDDVALGILGDGVIFCAHPLDERFFLFVPGGRRSDGELPVHHYDYQDRANSEPWEPSDDFVSFEDCLLEVLGEVDEATKDGPSE